MAPLQHIVKFVPAFDRRDPDPAKNYGIHGVTLFMTLVGDLGAISFCVYTNWHLPHVTKERNSKPYEAINGDAHWMERPMAANVSYHSLAPVPDRESHKCEWLGDRLCYGEVLTFSGADHYLDVLIEKGDEGLWGELEEAYNEQFGNRAVEPQV